MIESLKVEITPTHVAKTDTKEFRIRLKVYGKDLVEKRQLCEPDELSSFFDQMFDCAKQEILKELKADKEKKENGSN